MIPTGLREIDRLQTQVEDIQKTVSDANANQQHQLDQMHAHVREIREAVTTALEILEGKIEERLQAALSSDLGDRIQRLERIIEPLRITAEDVANGVELRYRGTDGRWIPLQASDVADFVMAGKKVIKLVPQVVEAP